MKTRHLMLTVLMTSCILLSCTGCSFTESWNLLWGSSESNAMTAEEIQKMKDEKTIVVVDDKMEAPVFEQNLGGSDTYQVGAGAKTLVVEASVSGGQVSYQWYSNSAASNGGGTKIEGATEASYTPSTAEKGTSYYFCVATNTVNGKVHMSTSQVATIVVEDIEDKSVLDAEELEEPETKKKDTKKEDAKKEESKKDDSKKSDSKKEESKKDDSKEKETKKDTSKDDSKKEDTKKAS